MARFNGLVGFGLPSETEPGVWTDTIVEKRYWGDSVRESSSQSSDDAINNTITLGHSLSLVADTFAHDHYYAIRYVKVGGAYWTVTKVELKYPRLLLSVGGVYNGVKA